MKRIVPFLVALFLVLSLAGIAPASERLSLMLEWFPNVDHLPLFVATEEGYFDDEGLDVEILSPSDTSSSFKLALAGTVDVAVTYETQVLRSAAEGLRSVVVGKLVEHPLNVLLYVKGQGIESPVDLKGRDVGFTEPTIGEMWDLALATAGVEGYDSVDIQFAVVPSLVSNRVAAVMGGYRNYEYVELREKGYDPAYFTLADCGFPDFCELVFAVSPETAEARPEAIRGFRKALERATALIASDPDRAMEDFFQAVPEADRQLEALVFEETKALFPANQSLNAVKWQTYADFIADGGILSRKVDVLPLLWKEER